VIYHLQMITTLKQVPTVLLKMHEVCY